eukprot:873682-Alexandrium_andersonii.AAC.1
MGFAVAKNALRRRPAPPALDLRQAPISFKGVSRGTRMPNAVRTLDLDADRLRRGTQGLPVPVGAGVEDQAVLAGLPLPLLQDVLGVPCVHDHALVAARLGALPARSRAKEESDLLRGRVQDDVLAAEL